jgi:hypothetical protein
MVFSACMSGSLKAVPGSRHEIDIAHPIFEPAGICDSRLRGYIVNDSGSAARGYRSAYPAQQLCAERCVTGCKHRAASVSGLLCGLVNYLPAQPAYRA